MKPIELETVMGFIFIRFRSGGVSIAEEINPILAPLASYRIEQMEPLGPHATAPIPRPIKR